jgi:hypothetical protein
LQKKLCRLSNKQIDVNLLLINCLIIVTCGFSDF